MAAQVRKVYWAGDLFNFKDLLGNRLLADAFDRAALGRWKALLPQETESKSARSGIIRDNNLENLFTCDAIIANFDGSDLDSGTVVEFCYAKFLDLPAVLLRTDFRRNGDQGVGGDPWNLMCSAYPRTETMTLHAMEELYKAGGNMEQFLAFLAGELVRKLDLAANQPPINLDFEAETAAFQRAVISAGSTLPDRFSRERIRRILQDRAERNSSCRNPL